MKINKIEIDKTKIYVILTASFLGIFIGVQSRSFEDVNAILLRDMNSNIFQEIKILKEKNEDLKKEITSLEESIGQFKNQDSALKAIEEEIMKYTKLSGEVPVFGPGISLKLDRGITTPWMIDLINELFASGAQAVSVNGIRLSNKSVGFDTLPQGQMVLNGSILSPPFEFKAIGESSALETNLSVKNGILERLKTTFKDLKSEISRKDTLQIE